MASAFTHAFAAVALTKTISAEKRDCRFWTVLVGSAVLPDAHVIGFTVGIESLSRLMVSRADPDGCPRHYGLIGAWPAQS